MSVHSQISADELHHALAILLAPPDSRSVAPMSAIIGFERYLSQTHALCCGWRSGPPERPRGVCVALLLPGRTALILSPTPGRFGIEELAQQEVTRATLADLADRDVTHAQALLETSDTARRKLMTGLGFRALAQLEYLERDAQFPWVDPPAPADASWCAYGDDNHQRFAAVIAGTYIGTLDCPELSQLRTVDDAIAGHRAAGAFDARRWEIARVADRDAGVLLFAPHAEASLGEVVYCGVVPEFRHRGVGALLVRRALYHCRQLRLKRLTLVVDARNTPAKRLYARLGLERSMLREALLLPACRFPPA